MKQDKPRVIIDLGIANQFNLRRDQVPWLPLTALLRLLCYDQIRCWMNIRFCNRIDDVNLSFLESGALLSRLDYANC